MEGPCVVAFVCVCVCVRMRVRKNENEMGPNRNTKSEKFFRVINEVPTVAMIAIVIFVVIKPF